MQYLVILIAFFIWIGNPNNCLRFYKRRQAFLLLNDMPFCLKVCFSHLLTIFGQYLEQVTLNKVLYINYIALAIDPLLGPCLLP